MMTTRTFINVDYVRPTNDVVTYIEARVRLKLVKAGRQRCTQYTNVFESGPQECTVCSCQQSDTAGVDLSYLVCLEQFLFQQLRVHLPIVAATADTVSTLQLSLKPGKRVTRVLACSCLQFLLES